MITGRKLTHEDIWERIQKTSTDAVTLAEVKLLGFWPSDGAQPGFTEQFVEERTRLETQLRQLSTELAQVRDPEAALRMLHEERKKAALAKREETRRKRNTERFE